jgi:hypothetical protein
VIFTGQGAIQDVDGVELDGPRPRVNEARERLGGGGCSRW